MTTLQPSGTNSTTTTKKPLKIPPNHHHDTHLHLETSQGPITIQLYHLHAPISSYNLSQLARQKYFDGGEIRRVVKGAFLQMGRPAAAEAGSGRACNGELYHERPSKLLRHVGAGIVSMCCNKQNLIGSQFVITLAPLPYLDGKQTIVGRVEKGMSVLQRIQGVELAGERPREAIYVEKAWVEKREE